ncbi:hypothetical protein RhiirA4_523939 [Rhizophagus irregularis]|uniref:Uncharacterized protein n=1 Tax=Rhizophagus irregularis TaxID=588596 RepID=A0A2I1HSF7_9GLOM|nr:hypothetical protein RhiirA4_523939 [Rhizophagus irregularis]
MDFYRVNEIKNWTCVNLTEYYRSKTKQKDNKQIFDRIKKDLQEVVDSTSLDINLKQDCGRVNVEHLQVKQVNQLATGSGAIYNDKSPAIFNYFEKSKQFFIYIQLERSGKLIQIIPQNKEKPLNLRADQA